MRLVSAVAVLMALVLCGSAGAAVRSGSIDDPDDVPGSLSGPSMPDVQSVSVRYDDAGSLTFTVGFWEDTRQRPASWLSTRVQIIVGRVGAIGDSRGCDYILFPEKHYFAGSISIGGYADGMIAGYEGELHPPVQVSDDGRVLSATYTHAALAGRDYQCVSPLMTTSVAGYDHYNPYCDCWTGSTTAYDDHLETFFFDGFAPPPPAPPASPTDPSAPPSEPVELPECSDGIDNDTDGMTDYPADPSCTSPRDDSESPYSTPRSKSSKPRLPTITVSDARYYLATALARQFKRTYRNGTVKRVSGCRRTAPSRMRCGVSWRYGQRRWSGVAAIWYSLVGREVHWNYGWTLRSVDHACRARHGKRCMRVYRMS